MVNYNLLYPLQRIKKPPRRELAARETIKKDPRWEFAARAKSEKDPSLIVCSSCKEWKRTLADSLHTVQQQKRPLFLHLQLMQAPKMILSDHSHVLQTPKMLHFDPLQALQTAKKPPFRLLASHANLNPATLTRVCNTYQEELHRMSTACWVCLPPHLIMPNLYKKSNPSQSSQKAREPELQNLKYKQLETRT